MIQTSPPESTSIDTRTRDAVPEGEAMPPGKAGPQRRRWGVPALLGGLALLLVIVLVSASLLGGDRSMFTTKPEGYAAIRALLEDEGVTVTSTTTLSETLGQVGPQTTVVIMPGATEAAGQLQQLITAGVGRIVLVNPMAGFLADQAVPVRVGAAPSGVYQPNCADPAAGRAGAVELPRVANAFSSPSATLSCYGGGEGSLYSVVPMPGGQVHILTVPFNNEALAREGNASLAMQVLGQHERLVWYKPSGNPGTYTDDRDDNVPSLVGPNWLHAVALALLALVICAIWRGRRLGPIITERLPVIIPASETVEGHGRLYARLGVREHAAGQLRTAARRRLSRLLGHLDDSEALAHSLADRTGHPYAQIRQWLDGPPPVTDDELVMLKRQLDALEQEARQP